MEDNITENNLEDVVAEPQNQNRGDSQSKIAGAIILAGVLIAGAIMLKGTAPQVSTGTNINTDNAGAVMLGRAVSADDHILGNPNAKIIIVEYSDLECPYCKVFHETMQKVVQESKNNVAWVYRHYPIAQLHPKAFHEEEAAECAFDQGGNEAFWKYIDRVFEITPSNNGLDVAELPKIAQYIGLNVTSFNECLSSGKFKSKVQADIDDGAKAGVNGTPSSFILQNGKLIDSIPGAQPYETVMRRLSEIK